VVEGLVHYLTVSQAFGLGVHPPTEVPIQCTIVGFLVGISVAGGGASSDCLGTGYIVPPRGAGVGRPGDTLCGIGGRCVSG
jgi:hypothetical protein